MSGKTCILCGSAADGRLRVAFWEEEEKGRLCAQSAAVCAACHARFLAGELSRVEVARRAHEARGYAPAEWIGRIDRDPLLDVCCLGCGVLLPVAGAAPARLRCERCGAENVFGERRGPGGTVTLTVALAGEPAPAPEPPRA